MTNNDNLAEQLLTPEPKEYTQELIYSLEIRDKGWVNIVAGTLELSISDAAADVEFEAVIAGCEDNAPWSTVQGLLSDIIGLKSVEAEEVV